MNCPEIRALTGAYADRELDLVRATEFEQHLSSCRSCSQELENIRAMSSALRSSTFYFRSPAELRSRILTLTSTRNGPSRLPKVSPTDNKSWTQWMRWFIPVAASAAMILVAISVVPTAERRLAEDVVSSHVRSMMAEHLTDVASSDQHTVKPWFDGRIDFAPPVTNLANQGFPLIGGRLDYFQNRPVAAEVYQRNKHIINLFVWPAMQNRTTTKKLTNSRGYHIISWENFGMHYSVVSDLNAGELREFTELLK